MARDIYEDHDEMAAEVAGEGLGNGLVITTTIVLVIACWFMVQGLKTHYNEGPLADKTAPAPVE